MKTEFIDALAEQLTFALSGQPFAASERVAVYQQGGPKAGQVTYSVDYPSGGSGNPQMVGVFVDVDVWAKGPDSAGAETIAAIIEKAVFGYSVNTENQGTVRMNGAFNRSYMGYEEEKLAHITMRFSGRAFRRF